MSLETALASAADDAPPVSICHLAVVHWLVKANAISAGDQDALVSGTKAHEWGNKLVAYTDQKFTKADLGKAPAGLVIGFFTRDKVLQHSMVTTGGGLLAGMNNANVLTASIATKVGTKYAKVTTDQLNWLDNSRVGLNACEVRGAAPAAVAKRIKG